MKIFAKLFLALVIAVTIIGPRMAVAQMPVIDIGSIAKEVQILTNAEQQLQQDENIVTNGKAQLQQLVASGQTLTSGQWAGVQGLIGRMQQMNTISSETAQLNAGVSQRFGTLFPQYNGATQNYAQYFHQVNTTTTQSEAQALSIANATDATTPQVNAQLAVIARTRPAGQTQAIQQLTQVCTILTQQVNQLLNLQVASMKMMAYDYQQRQLQQANDVTSNNTALYNEAANNPFAGLAGGDASPPPIP